MLSGAIKDSVDLRDGGISEADKANSVEIDQLLTGLIKRSIAKRTNRETRTVIADLFDIEKLRTLRTMFQQQNRAERVDDDLCVTAEDFKKSLANFIAGREIELIYSMLDVNESGHNPSLSNLNLKPVTTSTRTCYNHTNQE